MFLNIQPTIYGSIHHDISHNLSKVWLNDRSKKFDLEIVVCQKYQGYNFICSDADFN